MSGSNPLKPTGYDNEAIFAQKTHDSNFGPANKIRSTRDIRVSRSHNGIFLRNKVRPSPSVQSVAINAYVIQALPTPITAASVLSMYANYFIAIDDSGNPVRIAKNPKLRCSIASEIIDGNTWAYTYQTVGQYKYVTRQAKSGTAIEYQIIVPRYLGEDDIWAVEVDNDDLEGMMSVADAAGAAGTPITLMDLNVDGRAWAARASQNGYENS